MPPIRILHYVNNWAIQGGVEQWLMHIFRRIDLERFKIDLIVSGHGLATHTFDEELHSLGIRFTVFEHQYRDLGFSKELKHHIDRNGPYDMVHAHTHYVAGSVLRIAYQMGVPHRIVHAHTDMRAAETRASLYRKLFYKLMNIWTRRYATAGIGVSEFAATSLYGDNWRDLPRWHLVYCGIDMNPFQETVDRAAVRDELNLPQDAVVVGHVGRFDEQKNHRFLVEIAVQVLRSNPNFHFLLVGDGVLLHQEIKAKVQNYGIEKHFTFAGVRSDIPRLMKGAMDLFLLPSLYEGLPLVLIEAQAAGLPYILSDVIAAEVDVIKGLGKRISLKASALEWAQAVLKIGAAARATSQEDALAAMEASQFNISYSVRALEAFYDRLVS